MKKTSLIVAVLFLSVRAAFSAASLILGPESRIYLTGTSTLHPYASTSTLTQIVADLEAPVDLADIAHRAPFQKFEVVIPVKGLKSGESGLDKNMYKALKAGDAPDILFVLTHYEALAAGPDGVLPFKATGRLTIAGAQKEIELTGRVPLVTDLLIIDGTYELRMSDYGIKPPTLLLGAIKVGDPVVIHYHLSFQLTKGATQ